MNLKHPLYLMERAAPAALLYGYVALFFLFLLAPIAIVVVVSFSDAAFIRFPIEHFSLRWYHRLIEYRPFLDSLLLSLELAVASALLAAAFAIPAALSLARNRSALADLLSTFLLAPLSIPMILLGVALLYYLSRLGTGISFLSLLIGHTVVSIPYVMRTVVGVYRNVGTQYEESAALLGAGRLDILRHITLPLIKPGIFSGMLFSILVSLDNLPLSFFFASAQTNTLPVVMLSYLQNQFDPAIAAISTIQLLIALVALVAIERTYGLGGMTQ